MQIPDNSDRATYPLRVAARMTGMPPELIRAWESRYEAIRPTRTAGGSRRYSVADLRRLKVLREVVDAGNRIGRVAHLSLEELQEILPGPAGWDSDPLNRLLSTIEQLDSVGARRDLLARMTQLGPLEFVRSVALPLLARIGRLWEKGELSISAEHFTTAILRSLLMPLIDNERVLRDAPRVVFATPSGEPHDIGTLIAAVVAKHCGADAVFVGADVPVDDLVECTTRVRAVALVLGIVTLPEEAARSALHDLRDRLPREVGVWIGGAGIADLAPIKDVIRIASLDQLEAEVTNLGGGNATVQTDATSLSKPPN